jgi:hypothetical protein
MSTRHTAAYWLELMAGKKELEFRDMHMGNKGANAIGEGLKLNTSLTSLGLADHYLGIEGARVIGEGLKTNTSLTSLDFGTISFEEAMELREGLISNTSLISLRVHWQNHYLGETEPFEDTIKRNKERINAWQLAFISGFCHWEPTEVAPTPVSELVCFPHLTQLILWSSSDSSRWSEKPDI